VAMSAPKDPRLSEAPPSEAIKSVSDALSAAKSCWRATKVTSARRVLFQGGRVLTYWVQVTGGSGEGVSGATETILTGIVY
jgi:hypothetical protein